MPLELPKFEVPKVAFKIINPPDQSTSSHSGNTTSDNLKKNLQSYGYNSSSFWVPPGSYIRWVQPAEAELENRCEYDMDEQDHEWLTALNADRKRLGFDQIPFEFFEIVMDRLEKEWFQLNRKLIKPDANSIPTEDSRCAICEDGDTENSNAIVFCDGCNLAVHQDCYGIPYIPEGQWLCRKCTVSPDRPVTCALCPNSYGAFKLTAENEWAHLICAIHIPETGVGNAMYMEPIDGVHNIPKQRWKLKCYVCKQTTGACIQCSSRNCFVAYHVTCAQESGLYLKMKPSAPVPTTTTSNGLADSPPNSAQTAGGPAAGEGPAHTRSFCDKHTPKGHIETLQGAAQIRCAALKKEAHDQTKEENAEDGPSMDYLLTLTPKKFTSIDDLRALKQLATGSQSYKSARAYRKTYSSGPPLVPEYIFQRVVEYCNKLRCQYKKAVITLVCRYWSLKREARRGAPLLKRLHVEPWTAANPTSPQDEADRRRKYDLLVRIRQDLQHVKNLVSVVCKREKVKVMRAELQKEVLEKSLYPQYPSMHRALSAAIDADKQKYFLNPVAPTDVPDYHDIIKKPMDWTTIRNRLDQYQYASIPDFIADLQLPITNSKIYNKPTTTYHKAALRVERVLQPIIAELSAYQHLSPIPTSSDSRFPDSLQTLHFLQFPLLFTPETLQSLIGSGQGHPCVPSPKRTYEELLEGRNAKREKREKAALIKQAAIIAAPPSRCVPKKPARLNLGTSTADQSDSGNKVAAVESSSKTSITTPLVPTIDTTKASKGKPNARSRKNSKASSGMAGASRRTSVVCETSSRTPTTPGSGSKPATKRRRRSSADTAAPVAKRPPPRVKPPEQVAQEAAIDAHYPDATPGQRRSLKLRALHAVRIADREKNMSEAEKAKRHRLRQYIRDRRESERAQQGAPPFLIGIADEDLGGCLPKVSPNVGQGAKGSEMTPAIDEEFADWDDEQLAAIVATDQADLEISQRIFQEAEQAQREEEQARAAPAPQTDLSLYPQTQYGMEALHPSMTENTWADAQWKYTTGLDSLDPMQPVHFSPYETYDTAQFDMGQPGSSNPAMHLEAEPTEAEKMQQLELWAQTYYRRWMEADQQQRVIEDVRPESMVVEETEDNRMLMMSSAAQEEEDIARAARESENAQIAEAEEAIQGAQTEEVIQGAQPGEVDQRAQTEEAVEVTHHEANSAAPIEDAISRPSIEQSIQVALDETIPVAEIEDAAPVAQIEDATPAPQVEEAIPVNQIEEAISVTQIEEAIPVTHIEEAVQGVEAEETRIAAEAEETQLATGLENAPIDAEADEVESTIVSRDKESLELFPTAEMGESAVEPPTAEELRVVNGEEVNVVNATVEGVTEAPVALSPVDPEEVPVIESEQDSLTLEMNDSSKSSVNVSTTDAEDVPADPKSTDMPTTNPEIAEQSESAMPLDDPQQAEAGVSGLTLQSRDSNRAGKKSRIRVKQLAPKKPTAESSAQPPHSDSPQACSSTQPSIQKLRLRLDRSLDDRDPQEGSEIAEGNDIALPHQTAMRATRSEQEKQKSKSTKSIAGLIGQPEFVTDLPDERDSFRLFNTGYILPEGTRRHGATPSTSHYDSSVHDAGPSSRRSTLEPPGTPALRQSKRRKGRISDPGVRPNSPSTRQQRPALTNRPREFSLDNAKHRTSHSLDETRALNGLLMLDTELQTGRLGDQIINSLTDSLVTEEGSSDLSEAPSPDPSHPIVDSSAEASQVAVPPTVPDAMDMSEPTLSVDAPTVITPTTRSQLTRASSQPINKPSKRSTSNKGSQSNPKKNQRYKGEEKDLPRNEHGFYIYPRAVHNSNKNGIHHLAGRAFSRLSRLTRLKEGPVPDGTLVWAKVPGHNWFPGEVGLSTDPQIPQKVLDRLTKLPKSDNSILVMFFEKTRSWQWVQRQYTRYLGECEELDVLLCSDAFVLNKVKRDEIVAAYEFAKSNIEVSEDGEAQAVPTTQADGEDKQPSTSTQQPIARPILRTTRSSRLRSMEERELGLTGGEKVEDANHLTDAEKVEDEAEDMDIDTGTDDREHQSSQENEEGDESGEDLTEADDESDTETSFQGVVENTVNLEGSPALTRSGRLRRSSRTSNI